MTGQDFDLTAEWGHSGSGDTVYRKAYQARAGSWLSYHERNVLNRALKTQKVLCLMHIARRIATILTIPIERPMGVRT